MIIPIVLITQLVGSTLIWAASLALARKSMPEGLLAGYLICFFLWPLGLCFLIMDAAEGIYKTIRKDMIKPDEN